MFGMFRARGARVGFAPPWAGPFGRFRGGFGEEEGRPWFGPPFGRFGRRFGGFGPPRAGRAFRRGDLRYLILDLLKDQPRHGYDVMRALEERFRGFYTPSQGSVYPTLQLLEDQGFVTSTQQDGKRVYAITEEGRRFLAERADAVDDRSDRAAGWGFGPPPELGELLHELRQLGQLLFRHGSRGALHDPQKIRRLREVVSRARGEVEAIFADREGAPPTTSL